MATNDTYSQEPKTSRQLVSFLAEFWRFDRKGTLRTLALNLAGAVLEGMGLMLLLPMLYLAGVVGAGEDYSASLSRFIPAPAVAWLHSIPPNLRLTVMLAVFVGLMALQSAVALLRERQSTLLQLRFVDHLRGGLFGALARSRWHFLSRHHSSEFLSVLTNDVGRVGQGTFHLLRLFTQVAVFPAYLIVAFRLSPSITTLAVLTGAVLWWTLRKSRQAAEQSGSVLMVAYQGLFKEIQEFLGALKLIKIHGEEAGYQRQFAHVLENLREHSMTNQMLHDRTQAVFRVGSAVALAALTYVSLEIVQVPGASLLVLVAIFSRMLPQVSGIHLSLQQLWQMGPSFDNWQHWLRACAAETDSIQAVGRPEPLKSGIHLKDVCYRHPAGTQVFNVPSLLIPAQRTTAIVGPTGSGKTTLLDLICGLNVPDSGSVEADGLTLSSRPGWHRQIAYIPQETAILDGTVRENLTWGAVGAAEESLLGALQQAAADEFVKRLPNGLDTKVGERGIRLSGGEKQRLALARALLRRPQILILDESTNALDREHQQVVLEAIKKLNGQMTVLVVTHRLPEIIDMVDGVVHVDSGQVGPWVSVSTEKTL